MENKKNLKQFVKDCYKEKEKGTKGIKCNKCQYYFLCIDLREEKT